MALVVTEVVSAVGADPKEKPVALVIAGVVVAVVPKLNDDDVVVAVVLSPWLTGADVASPRARSLR